MDRSIMNAVDCIIDIRGKYLVLIKRKLEPFKDWWALPGGRHDPSETLQGALLKMLKEKLGLKLKGDYSEIPNRITLVDLNYTTNLNQIRTYDSGTDRRGGNTTVFAIEVELEPEALQKLFKPGPAVEEIRIFEKDKLPELAFQHAKFIEQYYRYLKVFHHDKMDISRFESPGVTVDIVVFTIKDNDLKVMLVKRPDPPFKGRYALPGGFVQLDESLESCVKRKLFEDAKVSDVYFEQLYTFGEADRDPRGRVISIGYFSLIDYKLLTVQPVEGMKPHEWFSAYTLPELAFDHRKMIETALLRIRNKIEYTNLAFHLLPERFTLTELQRVHEIIHNKKLDKRNFRKKIKASGILKPLHENKMEGAHRPAQLFSFVEKK